MKRYLPFVLALLLTVSLCACQVSLSVDTQPSTPTETKAAETTVPTETISITDPLPSGTEPLLYGSYRCQIPDTQDSQGVSEIITFDGGTVTWENTFWGSQKTGTYSVAGDALTIHYDTLYNFDPESGETVRTDIDENETFRIRSEEEIISALGGAVYNK